MTTLVVSGQDTGADRRRRPATLADWMVGDGAGVALPDVAHTLNHHRARHAQFATVCARDRAAGGAGLAGAGRRPVGRRSGGSARRAVRPGTVFVYSGQGSHWTGMGRQLLADEPVFAAAIAQLEPAFVEQVGFSLWQVIAERRTGQRRRAGTAGADGPATGADRAVALLRGAPRRGHRAFDGRGHRRRGGRGADRCADGLRVIAARSQ